MHSPHESPWKNQHFQKAKYAFKDLSHKVTLIVATS